jgi:hypothetical protein
MGIFQSVLALILGVSVLAGEIPHQTETIIRDFLVLWWLDSWNREKLDSRLKKLYT